METRNLYNLRSGKVSRAPYTNTNTTEGNIMSELDAAMEWKLDIIIDQLSKLQSLPSQLEAMKQGIKSLRGAVSDMAESVEIMENEVDRVKENRL